MCEKVRLVPISIQQVREDFSVNNAPSQYGYGINFALAGIELHNALTSSYEEEINDKLNKRLTNPFKKCDNYSIVINILRDLFIYLKLRKEKKLCNDKVPDLDRDIDPVVCEIKTHPSGKHNLKVEEQDANSELSKQLINYMHATNTNVCLLLDIGIQSDKYIIYQFFRASRYRQ